MTDGLTTPATPAEGESSSAATPADIGDSLATLALEDSTAAADEAALAGASYSTPEYYFPSGPSDWHPAHPLFDLEQLGIDRRLVSTVSLPSAQSHRPCADPTSRASPQTQLVNRKKQLKMYRCWMQVRARKVLDGQVPTKLVQPEDRKKD